MREESGERIQVTRSTSCARSRFHVNSRFRSSSVDFINLIIDRYSLAQDKVKLVFVVHPGGKKFMSLVLDLTMVAIKEIMRRQKYAPGKTFDMNEVMSTVCNMKEVEDDIVSSIKVESKVIKEKTGAIQELIAKIYPSTDFPKFIGAWHDHNKHRMSQIKRRNEEIDNIYQLTVQLRQRALQMLSPKSFETTEPPVGEVKDMAEFYGASAAAKDDSIPSPTVGDKVNFSWLIDQLNLVLPTIISYTSNFTIDSPETSIEELKVLQRVSFDVAKIESSIEEFSAKWRRMAREVVPKLKQHKEERDRMQPTDESPEEQAAKDQIEQEKMKILTSPKYYFDASKHCLKHVVVKKNRLALMDEADEGKENLANETKLFRPIKSPYTGNKSSRLNQSKMHEMIPPKQQPRRRLNPMEMLERATSSDASKARRDVNSTSRFIGAAPKFLKAATPGLSSTMIASDRTQHLFNCSTISDIMKSSPGMPQTPEIITEESSQWPTVVDRGVQQAAAESSFNAPWNDVHTSPKGGLEPLVITENIHKTTPRVIVTNETMKNFFSSTADEPEESTLKNKSEKNSDNYSFGSFQLPNDENLFNISDTVLIGVDE